MPLRINFHFPGFGGNCFMRLYSFVVCWKSLWTSIHGLTGLVVGIPSAMYFMGELFFMGRLSSSWAYCMAVFFAFALTNLFQSILTWAILNIRCVARNRIAQGAIFIIPLGYVTFLALYSYPVKNYWVYLWLTEYLTFISLAAGISFWIIRCEGDYEGPFWFLRGLGPHPETMTEAIERKCTRDDEEVAGPPQPSMSFGNPVSEGPVYVPRAPETQPEMDFAALLD